MVEGTGMSISSILYVLLLDRSCGSICRRSGRAIEIQHFFGEKRWCYNWLKNRPRTKFRLMKIALWKESTKTYEFVNDQAFEDKCNAHNNKNQIPK